MMFDIFFAPSICWTVFFAWVHACGVPAATVSDSQDGKQKLSQVLLAKLNRGVAATSSDPSWITRSSLRQHRHTSAASWKPCKQQYAREALTISLAFDFFCLYALDITKLHVFCDDSQCDLMLRTRWESALRDGSSIPLNCTCIKLVGLGPWGGTNFIQVFA